MTNDQITELLARAVEREYAARLTGAVHLQAEAMAHIRVLRQMLAENGGRGESGTTSEGK